MSEKVDDILDCWDEKTVQQRLEMIQKIMEKQLRQYIDSDVNQMNNTEERGLAKYIKFPKGIIIE